MGCSVHKEHKNPSFDDLVLEMQIEREDHPKVNPNQFEHKMKSVLISRCQSEEAIDPIPEQDNGKDLKSDIFNSTRMTASNNQSTRYKVIKLKRVQFDLDQNKVYSRMNRSRRRLNLDDIF